MQELKEALNQNTGYTRRLIRLAIVLMALLTAPQARPEGQHEFLLFLSGGPTYNDVSPESGPDGSDFAAAADFVYTYTNNRFRFLGEAIAATSESELERFQFGWQTGEDTTGWIGRFHSPSRYWNAIYHHGQYLQPSITRPLIEEFEDEGGVLPTHISGLMFDTSTELSRESGLQAVFSFGTAPVIGENALEPFDLLDSDSDHGAAVDFRIAFLPDLLGDNQAGIIMSWADLKIDGNQTAEQLGLLRVKQYTIGAYLDWRWNDWRILTSVASINNQDELQTQTLDDDFVSGYLQAEYNFHQDWILYGRLEESSGTEDSIYLTLFPNTIADRQVLGLRFDFARLQALTLEVSRTIEFAGADTESDRFGQAMLQWSTVLPWAW